MLVGVLKIAFFLRGNDSLKGKRHVIKKIKDRVAARFNVAISEVGANDSWEHFNLAIAAVGDEHRHINSVLDKIRTDIDDLYLAEIVDSRFEMIPFE